MKQMSHIWFIAIKDLKIFFKDRLAVFFFIVFPFLFVTLFNFMLGNTGSQDSRLVFHVVTREAETGLSHQILDSLETKDEATLTPGEPQIIWHTDYDELHLAVEDKEIAGFVAFPENFTEDLLTGNGTQLEIVVDAEATYARAALYGFADSISSQLGAQQVAIMATVDIMIRQGLLSGDSAKIMQFVEQSILDEATTGNNTLIQLGIDKVGEVEAEKAANFVVPGYLVMFVFFAAALSAETIVRERQNNTLERLLSSSVHREEILGGIFTGTAMKGLIQILVFWGIGMLVFQIDLGRSPLAVILLSVLMIIMSAAFAIMLATLVKSERAAGSVAVLASLVLAPLGGCWWPLFITPKWMQFIAKFTPHGWATSGFNKLMLYGADFGDAVPEMLALLGFAAVFSLIAVWRFRTSAN